MCSFYRIYVTLNRDSSLLTRSKVWLQHYGITTLFCLLSVLLLCRPYKLRLTHTRPFEVLVTNHDPVKDEPRRTM